MQQSNSFILAVVGRCTMSRTQSARWLSQVQGLGLFVPAIRPDDLPARETAHQLGRHEPRSVQDTRQLFVAIVHRPESTRTGTGIRR